MVATMMGVLAAKAESRGSDGKEGWMGSWVHGEQQCSEPRPGGLPLGGRPWGALCRGPGQLWAPRQDLSRLHGMTVQQCVPHKDAGIRLKDAAEAALGSG